MPRAASSIARCSASTCRARRPKRRCGSKEERTATPGRSCPGARRTRAIRRRSRSASTASRWRSTKARVSLPRYDRKSGARAQRGADLHDQLRAEVEVAFGGDYGEEVSTELTADSTRARRLEVAPARPRRSSPGYGRRPAAARGGGRARTARGGAGARRRQHGDATQPRPSDHRHAALAARQSASQRMSAGLDVKDTLRLIGTHPMLAPIKRRRLHHALPACRGT